MSEKTSYIPTALLIIATLLALFSCGNTAWANQGDKYQMTINISGTVVADGSCTFDQAGQLNVDFNEVKLTGSGNNTVTLDGSYIRPLVSNFTCTGDTAGLLQMKMTSTTGTYENYNGTDVLGTGNGIVAVELLVDGVAKNMGQWFTVDQTNQPVLQAQLVQTGTTNSANVVSGDTFAASANLILAFN